MTRLSTPELVGRQLAEQYPAFPSPKGFAPFRRQLRRLQRTIRTVDRHLAGAPAGERIGRAQEWLLDNAHLVAETVSQVRIQLPRRFHRELPKVLDSAGNIRPRVQVLAEAAVAEALGVVDPERLRLLIEGHQTVQPLTTGELWAFPTMLRLSLLTELTGLALVAASRAAPDPGIEAQDVETGIGNRVQSLRRLETASWWVIFESVSAVELVLRNDPTGRYREMDFATRDRYRKVVEELARWSGRPEAQVAEFAVEAAASAPVEDERLRHVGHPLVDAGARRALERSLGCRVPAKRRLWRALIPFRLPLYLGAIGLLSVAIAVVVAGDLATWQTLLALVPASGLATGVVDWIVTHSVAPAWLPRLDSRHGAPPGCPTAIVIPALLTSEDEVDRLLEQLSTNMQGNASNQFAYVLLSDPGDADTARTHRDGALLERAAAGVRQLSRRHRGTEAPTVHLLHRERRWNPAEGRWMGWERKRGKLAQFNRLVLGGGSGEFQPVVGEMKRLVGTRFVITLDADTVLPPGTADRLVATLAHPLNEARFRSDGSVEAGYTVLQPRVDPAPSPGEDSIFSHAFQGDTTLDLYSRAVSDVHQDLFAEGTYVGKGIYDVRAFERSLAGRIPDNALLSHDLFEGAHGRAGLVSDVVLLEEYPSNPLAHFRRQHRWTRGDWQLLPWLMPWVPGAGGRRLRNRLSALNRWKILDNLRRSLLPPTVLAVLTAAWFLPAPTLWTSFGLAVLALPIMLGAMSVVHQFARTGSSRTAAATFLERGLRDTTQWLLRVSLLPFEATVQVDAIGRTLARLIQRRRLLEWISAAHTALATRAQGPGAYWRRMAVSPGMAVGLGGFLLVSGPSTGAVRILAAPCLALWFAAPSLAWAVSQPIRRKPRLSKAGERALRRVARRTWRFFEHELTPRHHWLIPDHLREEPGADPIHRTSPTNIGMALVAVIAAYDRGYLDRPRVGALLNNILESVQRLDRFRGHLFNWYDTHSRAVLTPQYVSTVDSGNLAAALLVVTGGCEDALNDPVLGDFQASGLVDTVAQLREVVAKVPLAPAEASEGLLKRLDRLIQFIEATPRTPAARHRLLEEISAEWLPAIHGALAAALERVTARGGLGAMEQALTWFEELSRHTQRQAAFVTTVVGWGKSAASPPAAFLSPDLPGGLTEAWATLQQQLDRVPPLAGIEAHSAETITLVCSLDAQLDGSGLPTAQRRDARAWCQGLKEALKTAAAASMPIRADLEAAARLAEQVFSEIDFRFLYNRDRSLFHIGYDVTARQLDPSHYDLLASEARLASLIAIAKGDVPLHHWIHLRRPLGRVRWRRIALSWSGTMFEFLMPALFTETPPATLLGRTCEAIVAQQRAFGRRHGVPWGISESGFARRDAGGGYQYRAFGVPGTGMRRELGDRLVVTPYASILALPFAPEAVLANIRALEAAGGFGRFGLLEAVDFGPTERAHAGVPLQSYMAHHQGMVMAAIGNVLGDGILRRRLHRDPRIRSATPLLYERMPWHAPLQRSWARKPSLELARGRRPSSLAPWAADPDHAIPQRHLLGNGRYSVLIGADGSGGSRWMGRALTRWRTDPDPGHWGPHLYLEDLESGQVHRLLPRSPAETQCRFAPHLASFSAEVANLHVRIEVLVSPRDDVEIRLLRIRNNTGRARRIAVSHAAEVALAPAAEDRRHPAFAKLFVQSEWVPEVMALHFWSRRSWAGQSPVHLGHTMVAGRPLVGPLEHETDRERFQGRTAPGKLPAALTTGRLSGTTGTTLDPVCVTRGELELPPNSLTTVAFVTAVAASGTEVLRTLNAYRSIPRVFAAITEAATQAEVSMQETNLTIEELAVAQELFSAVVHPHHALRARPLATAAASGQSALWPHAISGDLPIVAVSVDEAGDMPLVRQLLRAHRYWSAHGARVDLVLIDEQPSSYEQPVRDAIQAALSEQGGDTGSPAAGIFIVHATQLSAAERSAIYCAAHVFLAPAGGTLADQLARIRSLPPPLPEFVPLPSSPLRTEDTPALPRPSGLLFDNGIGGFSADGREYSIWHTGARCPPRAWVNVVANEQFGFLVSDQGTGFTWRDNSAENRLTPWRNDPLNPPPGEALYLRDEETGGIWSPTPEPAGSGAPYHIRHGAGYTVFHHHAFGLEQELRLFVHPHEPAKFIHLRLRNLWQRQRRITATYFAEWVLGAIRDITSPHVILDQDPATRALLARCPFNETSGARTAFLASSLPVHGATADRREFLGSAGRRDLPIGLGRIGLSGAVHRGLDPCATIQTHMDIAPGGAAEVWFVLGEADDDPGARRLACALTGPGTAEAAWAAATGEWRQRHDRLQVRTPEPAMDVLMNQWLPYQTLACRIWARTGLFQSSGAFGFRDQLQDVLALLPLEPGMARTHLLTAARHQFTEGDVLHWWHPISERGVRSRCSDDLVWLPYAVVEYVEQTGDSALLAEQVPYLTGNPLARGEMQRFTQFSASPEPAALYDHCRRALDRAWQLGVRGLPLIGTGDWNDGYDEVGHEGHGESIWLAWFLATALEGGARLADLVGEALDASRFRHRAEALRTAVETHGWDGHWYRRAYFDDGTPLGSAPSAEARIDSTAQTWAVLSGTAQPQRAAASMEAVWDQLVRPDDGLVLLLTPPFEHSRPSPGYIQAYPPGVRENGAQYSHAAAWVALAFARLGDGRRAMELFRMLNPVLHGDSPAATERYRGEPYVMAGDVLATPTRSGRAGWTWYTGSAGWLYRVGLEGILGVRRRGNRVSFKPCIPPEWPGFEMTWRLDGTTYEIRVENFTDEPGSVESVVLDGKPCEGGWVTLVPDGGRHTVMVRLGSGAPGPMG